jgi:NAD(P)H-hydrate repair Nnr-like enzyme with NAD(P)H-hydrate dehydratase domain
MTKVDIHSIQKLFQKRLPDSHKGSHGNVLAADITLKTKSEESMLITDVIENLGKAFKKIQN